MTHRLQRAALPFRSVNRPGVPGYDPALQRHHLLPRQLLSARAFAPLFGRIGPERIGFDDFRSNGLLLPASDKAAMRVGLPLHRGPHRHYNEMVFERVGQIDAEWSARVLVAPEVALDNAIMRLTLLQRASRRRLLATAKPPLKLNRKDPAGREKDFSALDAMAEALWHVSG